jgi:hypothetical protein
MKHETAALRLLKRARHSYGAAIERQADAQTVKAANRAARAARISFKATKAAIRLLDLDSEWEA